MNTRTTFIVLLIAVALATYFIVFELNPEDSDSPDPSTSLTSQAGEPLFDQAVESSKITKLTIRRGDAQPIVIERLPRDGWRQTQPVAWAANSWKIDSVADAAAGISYSRTLKSDLTPSAYGFSPAETTIEIAGDDFAHTIHLGREATAGKAFVTVDDAKAIYLVDDDLHDALNAFEPSDYRSTSLATMDANDARAVTLSRDGRTIMLIRKQGRWAFDEGASGRVDHDAVESLVSTISLASIESFVADNPDDLSAYGLADPAAVLTVTTDDATHTLRVGEARDLAGEQVFAMLDDAPVVFTLARKQVDQLNRSVNDLRDRKITNVARSDIREITLQRTGSEDLHFVLNEGVWSLDAAGFDVELGVVSDLIDQLVNARADSYRDSFADDRVATVRLAVAGESEDEVIRVARGEAADELLVRRGDESVTYVVKAAMLTRLFADKIAFRDRTVIDLPATELSSIHISKPSGERTISRDETGDWQLDGLDRTLFDNLLMRISRLSAKTWVDREPSKPDVTITLTLRDGKTRVVNLVPESLLGWTEAGVFELPAAVMDAFTADLRDRTVIQWSPTDIDAIDLGGITVERYNQTRYRRADGEMIDEEAAGQLFDQLAGLRATAFIEPGTTRFDANQPTMSLAIQADTSTTRLAQWSIQATDRNETIWRVDEGPLFTIEAEAVNRITQLIDQLQNP